LDGSTECELATPISGINNIDEILIVIDYLKQHKVKITNSDSFHVHVQAKDIDAKKIVIAWMQIESLVVGWFKKHRYHNSFCPEIIPQHKKSKNRPTISQLYSEAIHNAMEHHATMSLFHYRNRKTVEFRLSQATFDLVFLEGWIRFCMYFLHYAKKINVKNAFDTPPNMIRTSGDIISLFSIKDLKTLYFLKYLIKNQNKPK
jgi:hypothetical protein